MCHYTGTMIKTTLRLPEPVAAKLRERSRLEGRSMNDVAIDALARGLGEESPDDALRALRSLIVRPATGVFDPEEHERWRREFGLDGNLQEDLDWVRGSDWS